MPDCKTGILAHDLAGNKYINPSYLQIRERINYLIKNYLSTGVLYSHLHNLQLDLKIPYQRYPQPIDWQKINLEQITGTSNDLFMFQIINATKLEIQNQEFDTEIRDYLQSVNPQIACFLETTSNQNNIISKSLINEGKEKEEGQKFYLFREIYQHLTSDKLSTQDYTVKHDEFRRKLQEQIYNNALNRIINQWNAISIYVWLMAHSTGELQKVIVQPLQDEVNHLAKFWSISYWSFSDSFLSSLQNRTKNLKPLIKNQERQNEQKDEILELNYALHSVEVTFTFTSVMMQLYQWHKTLEYLYLKNLFAYPSNLGQAN